MGKNARSGEATKFALGMRLPLSSTTGIVVIRERGYRGSLRSVLDVQCFAVRAKLTCKISPQVRVFCALARHSLDHFDDIPIRIDDDVA